ncbi:hypothetical protein ACIQ1J_09930 [Streptomyces sp. NPDC097107]|uniref:hypothetical protein n=1 Tax=Streptomyces sp. NPDC097107 TaxID=3366089 RepID=UPI0037F8B9FE
MSIAGYDQRALGRHLTAAEPDKANHGHKPHAGALEEPRTALLLAGYRTRRAVALTLGIPRTSLNGRLES